METYLIGIGIYCWLLASLSIMKLGDALHCLRNWEKITIFLFWPFVLTITIFLEAIDWWKE